MKRHKKEGIRNGNSPNDIEVVLSNRLKISGIWAYDSVSRHFPFKIHLLKLQGTPHQSRDSRLMAVAGNSWPRPITSAVYSESQV
jgi:hypothetical protein